MKNRWTRVVNRADKGEQDATARSTLILFRLPALGSGKVATKDRKLWNSSTGSFYAAWPIHEYEVGRIGQCTREGKQFTIYRGTRFKSAFYGVTCDGHVEVDKGVRSTLNWGENGTRMKGGHGSSRVMHRKKKMMLNEMRMRRPKSIG